MIILGLDPGKTTGYATIAITDGARRTITPQSFGNTKDMQLIEIKHLLDDADVIVYEGWRTFDKVAKAGRLSFQTVPAEQVIGSMKTLLRLRKSQPVIHENLSALKPVGYAWSGMKYVPGKKGQHWQDAMAHAVHYAVDKLGALPVSKPGS